MMPHVIWFRRFLRGQQAGKFNAWSMAGERHMHWARAGRRGFFASSMHYIRGPQ